MLWPSDEESPEKNFAQITVLFESTGELQEEAPVVYKESRIGTVRSIQLGEGPSGPGGYYHVDVGVDSTQLSLLYHQMCILIKEDREAAYVEFEDASTDTPVSILERDKVIGSTRAGCTWEKMRRATGELIDEFAGTMEGYGVDMPSWVNSASISLKNTNRKNVESKIDQLRREAENAGQTLEEVFGDTALLRALLFKLAG